MRRFWSKVAIVSDDKCWEWTAAQYHDGYGAFKFEGRTMRAHRMAHELVNGPIPKGLIVMHSCDNPRCCNPAHLSVGTQGDNLQDMSRKGRNGMTLRTHCPQGHPYSGSNLLKYPRDGRRCRICRSKTHPSVLS